MTTTTNNIASLTLLGYGGVGKCFLACIPHMFPTLDLTTLTILDKDDHAPAPEVAPLLSKGAKYVVMELSRSNLKSALDQVVSPLQQGQEGQTIHMTVDLTVGISCLWEDDIHLNGDWLQSYAESKDTARLHSRTLYSRQVQVRKMFPKQSQSSNKKTKPSFTAVLDHSMNPGLVSHFTKLGLEKVARSTLAQLPATHPTAKILSTYLSNKIPPTTESLHANLAYLLGLRTIHISEKDTQLPIPSAEKKPGEFLSTWSPAGFHEEGLDPVQVGWGTHEHSLPASSIVSVDSEGNPGPQIYLPLRGIDLKMKSYVPRHGPIEGLNIPHSEAAALASYLTLSSDPAASPFLPAHNSKKRKTHLNSNSKIININSNNSKSDNNSGVFYRPTVHYVYHAPACAQDSWSEVRQSPTLTLQPSTRVLKGSEIQTGEDAVGVLLLFTQNPVSYILNPTSTPTSKPYTFWAGSILSISQTTTLLGPLPAPTTTQVVASLFGVISHLASQPSETGGEILGSEGGYLGGVVFEECEWEGVPAGLQFGEMVVGDKMALGFGCGGGRRSGEEEAGGYDEDEVPMTPCSLGSADGEMEEEEEVIRGKKARIAAGGGGNEVVVV
ncbi:hypothetical protein HDV05_008151 [Chytridiales sp. JEL 0842]|nr:hypothetical protein HDV05_008151 [Chytridiales sp. JEL 0842]